MGKNIFYFLYLVYLFLNIHGNEFKKDNLLNTVTLSKTIDRNFFKKKNVIKKVKNNNELFERILYKKYNNDNNYRYQLYNRNQNNYHNDILLKNIDFKNLN